MESIKQIFKKYKEIIMYLIMGGGTTVVNWGTYSIVISLCRFGTMDVFIANVVSWIFAVAFAYITNKIYVFESYSWNLRFVLKELGLFVSTRLATGLLEILGVPFLVNHGFDQEIFGLKGSVCKIAMSVFVVLLNYVFSKLIIFKKDEMA